MARRQPNSGILQGCLLAAVDPGTEGRQSDKSSVVSGDAHLDLVGAGTLHHRRRQIVPLELSGNAGFSADSAQEAHQRRLEFRTLLTSRLSTSKP